METETADRLSYSMAGPAFEGAKITCGMWGSKGAIDHVTVKDGENNWPCVIGETRGSGKSAAPVFWMGSSVLKLGKLMRQKTGEGVSFTDRVFLNQKDIRELQLAKAAIGGRYPEVFLREEGD